MNNKGDVVGSALPTMYTPRAFAYIANAAYDLNTLVVAGLDGSELTTAVAINDAGTIVAHSCQSGPCKAFRLDPLPDAGDPASVPAVSEFALALLIVMVAACGGLARRR